MRKSLIGFIASFFLVTTAILSFGQTSFSLPSNKTCSNISLGEKLYTATSSTSNGNIVHSLWLKNVFNDGTAKFDFIQGQLFHNDSGAELYGTLNLRTGGGTKDNSTWRVYLKYDPTNIVNPKLELGQDENLYETWIYYVLNADESFLVDLNDGSDVITFTHMGNPFQIGLSAGGKDIDEPSASGWFNWYRDGQTDKGDVNINISDLCPPTEGVSPTLECVEVLGNGEYLARFGYNNQNAEDVIIPVGGDNKFTPSPLDRGQPFNFLAGRQVDVFQIPFDGTNLVWTITSPNNSTRTGTASDNPDQFCEPDEEVCLPSAIDGGTVAFDGPYDPSGTNLIYNVELPSSEFSALGFEYIWMSSLTDVPNTPGNPHWSPIAGSEDLTELQVSGLVETTYYIRCARLDGCDTYWGETNTVTIEVDPCDPDDIDGGTVAFDGPYDPNGTNTIYNVELPSSPYEELGFQYIWMQSLDDVPNTPGNSSWSPIAGSEDLTELQVSDLLQTTYFIRCARLVGCDDYWGETPSVEVIVDPCLPAAIDGGEVAFDGPYDPDGTNTIYNVELPSSPYEELGFQYIWMQNDENEPNVLGNTNWTVVPGSENQVELDIPNITDTQYFIRCVRLVGCDVYWGESNIVEVNGFAIPTAVISGGGEVCEGETADVTISLTGVAPFTIIYTDGSNEIEINSNDLVVTLNALKGTYSLISVVDANFEANISGKAIVGEFESPTAILSGGGLVCGNETIDLDITFTGLPPFTFVYSNGSDEITVNDITENNYTFQAGPGEYELLSIADKNCSGSVDGSASVVSQEIPTATISGTTEVCANQTAVVSINLSGINGVADLSYTNGSEIFNVTTSDNVYTFDAVPGEYNLISVNNGNCEGEVNGEAIITEITSPTAVISGGNPVCEGELGTITIDFTGTGNWTTTYTDGVNQTTITSTTSSLNIEVPAGQYSLVNVSDDLCTGSVSGLANIEDLEIPTATISGGGAICGRDRATIIFNFTGSGPWEYTYRQGRNNITDISETQEARIMTNQLGTYTLISVNNGVCEGTVSGTAVVTTFDIPTGEINIDDSYCVGEQIVLTNTISDIGNTFSWSTSGSGDLIDANQREARYTAGNEETDVTFTLIVDNGCTEEVFTAIASFYNVSAEFVINPMPDNGIFLSNVAYEFIASDVDADSWEWDFGDGAMANGNIVEHSFSEQGNYNVSLSVINENCSAFEQLNIEVGTNQNLFIPNVFSPRSTNPENNSLKVYGEDISNDDFEFAVYNKWGQLVYRTSSLNDAQSIGWTGRSNSDENGNNVFTYIVRGRFNNGEVFEQTGAVTLVR